MTPPSRRPSANHDAKSGANRRRESDNYVDSQNGWRVVFLAALISSLIGLSFRLYFSPTRIKSVIEAALEKQPAAVGFSFDRARLSLARGARPQLALVLEGVHYAPAPLCHPEPSLSIAELTLPFRVSAFFHGRAAIGILSAQDLTVDLDGMKGDCAKNSGDKNAAQVEVVHAPRAPAASGEAASSTAKPADATPLRWWQPEQLQSAQQLIEGFDFERVDLQFEDRSKHVYLESMSARSRSGDDRVKVRTEVRIPPELVYGEKIPLLSLDADISADIARVTIRAGLSEGSLNGYAELTHSAQSPLDIDTHVTLHEVPLSTAVPLLNKAGLIQNDFQPKFQWLNCEASIKGPFQGLFASSVLHLKSCTIEGADSRVELAQAARRPNGEWEPFHVDVHHLDMNRVLAMFHLEGPAGISSDFGRLSGAVDVQNAKQAEFKGVLEGVSLMFSSRELHSEQKIKSCNLEISLAGDQLSAEIDEVELSGGDADLKARARFSKQTGLGDVSFELGRLRFDPAVNRLMLGGELADLNGRGHVSFEHAKVTGLDVALNAIGLSSEELKSPLLVVTTDYKTGSEVQIRARAAHMELSPQASWFKGLQPVLLGHEIEPGDDGKIDARDFNLVGAVPENGGLRWSQASLALENGKIQISSAGAFTRESELSGVVNADFPLIKKLQWTLSGHLEDPKVTRIEKSFLISHHTGFDDHILGLPAKKAAATQDSTLDEESKGALREIGKKVIEKARNILPKSDHD